MNKYDIKGYYKVIYDIMTTLYCYYYLCKCVFSSKKFHTNAAFMSLFFMYTLNMSYIFTLKISYRRVHI